MYSVLIIYALRLNFMHVIVLLRVEVQVCIWSPSLENPGYTTAIGSHCNKKLKCNDIHIVIVIYCKQAHAEPIDLYFVRL